MSFLRDLANRVRERVDAPALPQIGALPQVTPVPRQIGGIGSVLPTQTVTLPGGQTVQIPQLNMDEINANLLAAGITPQMPTPAVTPPVATPTTPTQAESIMQYLGEQGELQEGMDVDGDGEVTMLDAIQSLQIDQGLRNADGTAIPQAPAPNDLGELLPLGTDNGIDMSDFLGNREDSLAGAQALFGPQVQYATPTTGTGSGALLGRTYTDEERAELGIPSYSGGFLGKGTGATTLPITPPAVTTPAATRAPNTVGGAKLDAGLLPVTPTPAVSTVGQPMPDDRIYMGGTQGFYDAENQERMRTGNSLVATPAVTTPAEQLAPYTGAQASPEDMPFVPSVRQVATGLDPLTEQLLFGIGGQGGFIPGAMRAAERTFFNPDGTPRVIDEQVAGFTPDQLRAAELARQGVGVQDRFIEGAEGAFGRGIGALGEGFGRARGFAGQGLQATRSGLGDLTSGLSEQERISRGATGQFGQRLGGLGRQAMRSTTDFGGRLGESERLLRGTTGAYDPSLTSAFYNPFEDRVVQQTIDDVLERGAQTDIAARAGDIARGGESAFGSRARLGASERQEALGRGLGEAISGIRARGFSEAQQTGLSEFARQRAAERAASSGLAGLSASRLGAQQQLGSTLRGLSADQLAAQQGLAGTLGTLGAQRFGGQQALAGALTGLGGMESQLAQREQAAQFGLGSALQGLGSQAQGAQAADIASLYGMGTQQQAFNQAQLDAQRRNQLQAQQAPLAQYQALAPFVSMAPAGQFQTVTDFAPPPSPLQAGLGVGLSTFGALGNLYGGQG